MVTLREVLHDARQCVVARTVRSALLAATMVVVCAIGTFLASANDSLQTGLRGDAERHFVPIADSLADPAAFEEYSSPDGIARAAAFYNALNTVLSGGSFLSVFDQQVAVRSDETWHPYAAGPDGQAGPPAEYFHPAMGGQVFDVRSVQLNKNAWDFYGLRLAEGAGPLEWGDVDYRGPGPHPVMLGANLRGVAEVGDTIKIGFYNTVFEFRVVGFLTPRSMIYLRGDFNYSLDDTVVIPYPMMLDPAGASGDAKQFLRILTFAMISGNIALNDGETFDTIASEIAGLAQRARFHEYSLLGAAPYLTQFRSVRALVRSNTVLVGSSFRGGRCDRAAARCLGLAASLAGALHPRSSAVGCRRAQAGDSRPAAVGQCRLLGVVLCSFLHRGSRATWPRHCGAGARRCGCGQLLARRDDA